MVTEIYDSIKSINVYLIQIYFHNKYYFMLCICKLLDFCT